MEMRTLALAGVLAGGCGSESNTKGPDCWPGGELQNHLEAVRAEVDPTMLCANIPDDTCEDAIGGVLGVAAERMDSLGAAADTGEEQCTSVVAWSEQDATVQAHTVQMDGLMIRTGFKSIWVEVDGQSLGFSLNEMDPDHLRIFVGESEVPAYEYLEANTGQISAAVSRAAEHARWSAGWVEQKGKVVDADTGEFEGQEVSQVDVRF